MKYTEAMNLLHSGHTVSLDGVRYYKNAAGVTVKEIEGIRMVAVIPQILEYRDEWELVNE